MVNLSHPLNDLEKSVLNILLKAPDCRLQRCEIQKSLSGKYVPNVYSVGSLPVALHRTLQHLIVDFKMLEKDDQGHKQVYYYIPKNKQKKVKDTLFLESKKQEVADILDLASDEELNKITNFLFQLPPLYHAVSNASDSTGFLYWKKETLTKKIDDLSEVLWKLNMRVRLLKLKSVLAPDEVIKIGNKILEGKDTTKVENIKFVVYPVDSNDAQNILNYIEKTKAGKDDQKILFKNDSEFFKLLNERFNELLGRRLLTISS